LKKLEEKGIGSGLHYPITLNLQKAYSYLGFGRGSFPIAEKAAEKILSLPMYPGLEKSQIEYTCESLAKIIRG
jgi:dTDP-4-amino-4,6-dideoxygalactose transaminase